MVQSRDLIRRLNVDPFAPFKVRLTDGTLVSVPYPRMLVGEDRVLIVTKWKRSLRGFPIALDWRTVPLEMIESIIDAKAQRRTTTKSRGRRHAA